LWPCGDVVVPEGSEEVEKGFVCSAGCEVAVCLFACVWVGDVGGFVT
jgi:hypothetical protein